MLLLAVRTLDTFTSAIITQGHSFTLLLTSFQLSVRTSSPGSRRCSSQLDSAVCLCCWLSSTNKQKGFIKAFIIKHKQSVMNLFVLYLWWRQTSCSWWTIRQHLLPLSTAALTERWWVFHAPVSALEHVWYGLGHLRNSPVTFSYLTRPMSVL